jgi:hypothetical protein
MNAKRLVVNSFVAGTLGLALLGMLCAVLPGRAQSVAPTQIVTYYLPLERAAELLEQRYAVPVTYENPILVWPGELGVRRTPAGSEKPYFKEHSLALALLQ